MFISLVRSLTTAISMDSIVIAPLGSVISTKKRPRSASVRSSKPRLPRVPKLPREGRAPRGRRRGSGNRVISTRRSLGTSSSSSSRAVPRTTSSAASSRFDSHIALPQLTQTLVFPSGALGSETDSLPLSAVWRIMARVLPARASIDVEAVHIMTACAGEFIAFLAAAVRESSGVSTIGSTKNHGIEETLGALGEIG